MTSNAQVSVVMGSKSDDGHLKPAFVLLDEFGIKWEMQVLSAHRQPDELRRYIEDADARGIAVFIAAAMKRSLRNIMGCRAGSAVGGQP